ncbi:MAG: hypothetical protein JXA10_05360 [Anaerolineae bacterium]|nr:hypothetical protein [Anaerolineae bacterium]
MQNHLSSTDTFHAAHDLTIIHDGSSWRLYNGVQAPDLPGSEQPGTLIALLEAQVHQITCLPAFAKARNLPGNGQLEPADIARVVVGWAPESRNWHLGILLAPKPQNNFQQHWCGLASWPSGPSNESYDQARRAGLALARVINRPFQLVPAPEPLPPMSGETQPITSTQEMRAISAAAIAASNGVGTYEQAAPRPVTPPVTSPLTPPRAQPVVEPLPAIKHRKPPFNFEEWTMREIKRGYVWGRRGRWLVSAVLRAAGYGVLALLFLLLGIGTQTRGLAAVEPGWLPWLGMVVAILLVGLAMRALWSVVVMADVVIDMPRQEARCQGRFFGQPTWRVSFDQIAYVLISQTPIRPEGRDKQAKPMNTSQDVWLHIYDGAAFLPVVTLGQVAGQCHAWGQLRQSYKSKGRRRLTLALYDTPAHHAAQVMADALQVEVWLDIR